MTGTDAPRRGWADTWKAPALVGAVAALVFARSLGNGFVWDDHRFIAENPSVVRPTSWLAFFTDAHTIDVYGAAGLVRPLRTFEFALDYALFGDSPAAFHAHSLLWHAAAAAMLCLLLRKLLADGRASPSPGGTRTTRGHGVAVLAALFWAVSPVQAECAAFISSRGDTAMCACSFAALYFATTSDGFDRRLIASLAAALVAMMYKETAVVLCAVVTVLVVVRRAKTPALLHWAVSAMFAAYWFAVSTGGASHGVPFEIGGSRLGTVATMCRGVGWYVCESLLPAQSLEWYMSPSWSFADGAVLAWLGAHLALVASAVVARRRAPLWTFAVAWFYGFLALTSNVIVSLAVPTFERFLVPAMGGVALALGCALLRAPRAARAAFVVVLAALGAQAVARTAMWRDDDALWTAVLADHESPRGHNFKAAALRIEARDLRAKAMKMPPGEERAKTLAETKARLEEALDHAHRAIALRYEFEGLPQSPTQITKYSETIASSLCHVLLRDEEALCHADRAIAGDVGPEHGPQYLDDVAEYDRALPLFALGYLPQAIRSMRRAWELLGRRPDAEITEHLMRGAAACEEAGLFAAAQEGYETAVDSAFDTAARISARARLEALRTRPRPADADALERRQIELLDAKLARIPRVCPVVRYPAPK